MDSRIKNFKISYCIETFTTLLLPAYGKVQSTNPTYTHCYSLYNMSYHNVYDVG